MLSVPVDDHTAFENALMKMQLLNTRFTLTLCGVDYLPNGPMDFNTLFGLVSELEEEYAAVFGMFGQVFGSMSSDKAVTVGLAGS